MSALTQRNSGEILNLSPGYLRVTFHELHPGDLVVSIKNDNYIVLIDELVPFFVVSVKRFHFQSDSFNRRKETLSIIALLNTGEAHEIRYDSYVGNSKIIVYKIHE